MDAVMLLTAGAALLVALAGLLRAIRADRRVDGLERGWVRDRDHLNRTLTYESGRTLR